VDLFLACCLPFDRVDFYRSYYLISVKHHKVEISRDTDWTASLIIFIICNDDMSVSIVAATFYTIRFDPQTKSLITMGKKYAKILP
jgi:hypothetical protein